MRVELEGTTDLRFGDGSPVRSASAMAPFGDGWLIVQDDATHAAWQRPGGIVAVRVIDAVGGHETFSAAAGTKYLKPDFESAFAVPGGVVLLGSGSTEARMRASLVTLTAGDPGYRIVDLAPVYHRVAAALGGRLDQLNLEGACRVGDRLRWFQRGNSAAGVPSAAVDVALPAAGVALPAPPDQLAIGRMRRYDLGTVGGVALAITDAVALPGGRVLVSAAAEDTPNPVDDGPVVGAALALLDDDGVIDVAPLPESGNGAYKVEGIAVRAVLPDGVRLLAVADADDPVAASPQLELRIAW
jgi:hypothetical protein